MAQRKRAESINEEDAIIDEDFTPKQRSYSMWTSGQSSEEAVKLTSFDSKSKTDFKSNIL